MFTFNNWYYKRCCKPCRCCHRCVIYFTTNDTFKRISEYPSKEMTSSNKKIKAVKALNSKKKAVKDKNGRYNLIVEDSDVTSMPKSKGYGSVGGKGSISSVKTNNATYGSSFDMDGDGEPSRSRNSFSVNKDK